MTSDRNHTAREYLRVSQDRTGRARSVDEQHQDHTADADRHGWTLGAPYVDVDASASRYARRARGGFADLVADLTADTFGAEILVLWESSRGSRKVSEWVELIELCERRKVRIWVHTHGTLYDPANPRHRRSMLEDAVDAEYESSKTRDRVRRATRAAAAAGRPHGRLLYGYQREYDNRGRYVRQVHHPEQAPVVREAARRVAAGESCYAIAADFNARGVRRPANGNSDGTRWHLETVKRVVTNPAYAGYRVHQGEIVGEGDWPPILSEQLWRACVARLTDPRRRTVLDGKVRHLLTGTALCAVCDTPLQVQKNRGFRAYLCGAGFCVSVKTTWLEEFVEEVLLQRLERPDALDLLTPPDMAEAAAQARTEAEDLRARLQGYYDQAADGDPPLSPAALARIEARILPRLAEAERRAHPAPVPEVVRQLPGPGARKRWADLSIGLRREVVQLVMVVKVGRTRQGARSFDPWRVEESRWVGDPLTWGDHWRQAEGIAAAPTE